MIYEIALLPVKTDRVEPFKRAFCELAHLLIRARGYEGHQLMQGVESPSHFNLIVRWRTIEDHTQGFEPSSDHQVLMTGLQEYLAAETVVHHVRPIASTKENGDLFC